MEWVKEENPEWSSEDSDEEEEEEEAVQLDAAQMQIEKELEQLMAGAEEEVDEEQIMAELGEVSVAKGRPLPFVKKVREGEGEERANAITGEDSARSRDQSVARGAGDRHQRRGCQERDREEEKGCEEQSAQVCGGDGQRGGGDQKETKNPREHPKAQKRQRDPGKGEQESEKRREMTVV